MRDYSNVIKALKTVDIKNPYGTELFNALARVTVSVAIEAVCLRFNTSTQEVEVYMVERSMSETAYPGELHVPGSILRSGEEIEDVFSRLQKKEFDAKILSWRFVANVNYPKGATRGHLLSLVYLCLLDENSGQLKGKWYPVDDFPEKTMKDQRKRIIPVAVGAFVAENTSVYR